MPTGEGEGNLGESQGKRPGWAQNFIRIKSETKLDIVVVFGHLS
jgi:hypothetical protein